MEVIERNVPLPTKRNRYGFIAGIYEKLEVGDSMKVTKKVENGLRVLASKKKQSGRFVFKKISENLFRVWRIK